MGRQPYAADVERPPSSTGSASHSNSKRRLTMVILKRPEYRSLLELHSNSGAPPRWT